MDIVIIGSGNVAYHLAKSCSRSHVKIAQIFGRNDAELSKISKELGIPYSTETLADADCYLLAVSDHAVAEVSSRITKEDCLVAHTSGSLPVEELKGAYRKASFYPLQTFSRNREQDYSKIPFFIEAEYENDAEILKTLAGKISPHVFDSNFEKRKYIHITAVFACNFVNHLFARAQEISDAQDIPFSYFEPLIAETVNKIRELPPKDAQTGPAVRADHRVLELHEALLGGEHLAIYKTMNQSIKKMYDL
ncbi:Rossmann-like and DUF2520 domain-containing protein [Chryseobacterium sp. MFBS3-17]|uniref:Rossmann-like and DUF2520 domain-containing protein n=1 Tax=Chryseobacterium sp. MFBS3-17 TaxID=2886689 RepID=UPI001D0E53E1|nr:Rossmann-like and DUF2520 domain-containing protein [Chryseobacterium sp. MFBS3-17]MCC2590430.1 DUF2520 domain-containing protein [Chryseobacterium sp. MFBS3-17]